MKVGVFGRTALSAVVAAALLAACGGTQPPISASGIMPQTRAIATHADRRSWMLPEAKSEDLLYVTGIEAIDVFSYPDGRMVGSLGNFDGPDGMCVDASGNVFIPIYYGAQVLEYAHGGQYPAATISTEGFPSDCSIDPTTGHLAVTSIAYLQVFSLKASGWNLEQSYAQPNGTEFSYNCTYDNAGNLFFDSNTSSASFQLSELGAGSASFTTISLNQSFTVPGGLVWDGGHLVVADARPRAHEHRKPLPTMVYRFAIQGAHGTETGRTELRTGFGSLFWIQGAKILSESGGGNIGFWTYPKGGKPRKVVSFPDATVGIAISPRG